jgi:hypothetical protein
MILFMQGEADAWYETNRDGVAFFEADDDIVITNLRPN